MNLKTEWIQSAGSKLVSQPVTSCSSRSALGPGTSASLQTRPFFFFFRLIYYSSLASATISKLIHSFSTQKRGKECMYYGFRHCWTNNHNNNNNKMPISKRTMAPIHHDVDNWVANNEMFFLPPVCVKMMHDTQLKVSPSHSIFVMKWDQFHNQSFYCLFCHLIIYS